MHKIQQEAEYKPLEIVFLSTNSMSQQDYKRISYFHINIQSGQLYLTQAIIGNIDGGKETGNEMDLAMITVY